MLVLQNGDHFDKDDMLIIMIMIITMFVMNMMLINKLYLPANG